VLGTLKSTIPAYLKDRFKSAVQSRPAAASASTLAAQAPDGLFNDESNHHENDEDSIYNNYATPRQPTNVAPENTQPRESNGPAYTGRNFALHDDAESSAPRQ
jgi:hypothetical protein